MSLLVCSLSCYVFPSQPSMKDRPVHFLCAAMGINSSLCLQRPPGHSWIFLCIPEPWIRHAWMLTPRKTCNFSSVCSPTVEQWMSNRRRPYKSAIQSDRRQRLLVWHHGWCGFFLPLCRHTPSAPGHEELPKGSAFIQLVTLLDDGDLY